MENEIGELTDVIKDLKTAIYILVEKYRKIAYSLHQGSKCINQFCLKLKGVVGEDGVFYVSKEMEDDFADAITRKCIRYGKEFVEFFDNVDFFVRKLLEFKDITFHLRKNSNNVFFKKMCQFWCGDYDNKKGVDGIRSLIETIERITDITSMEALDKFYEKYCEDDVDSILTTF
jgi:hypothetical protein